MNKYLERFLSRLYQSPGLLLFLLLFGVTALSTQLSKLHLDASADSLVLEGDEALQVYRSVNRKYGSEDFLIVTYSPTQGLFTQSVLDELNRLKTDFLALPEVSSVVSILDVPLLYSPPVKLNELSEGINYLADPDTDRSLARAEFLNSPLYSQLLTSNNFDTTALQINLKRDERYFSLLSERDRLREKKSFGGFTEEEGQALTHAEKAFSEYSVEANLKQERLVNSVRMILDKYRDSGTLFLGGVPMIASDMIDFIENDLIVFGTGILIFIVLLLAVIFRSVAWILLPLLTCVVTSLGMLGFIGLLDWKLTVISSNFVALLMIITLSINIHLAVRYRELSVSKGAVNRRNSSSNGTDNGDMETDSSNLSRRELVFETVRFMARPCFYTAITTVVAFASLVVSGIRPVIDFGWMMTIGVSAALVISFLVIPAGLLLIPLKQTQAPHTSSSPHPAFTYYFARFTDLHGKWVWFVSVLLLVVSIVGISRLQVENRFIDYFDPATEIYQGMEVIDQKLGGTIPLDIIIRSKNNSEHGNMTSEEVALKEDGINSTAENTNDEDPFGDISFDVFDSANSDPFGDETYGSSANYWFSRQGLMDIEKLHNYLDSLQQTGKVVSLASLYQVMKDVTDSDIDDFQLALIRKNLTSEIKDSLVAPFLSDDGNESRLSVRVKETSHELNRKELLDQIEQYLQQEMGLTRSQYDLTGMLVLYNNMLQSLFSSQILTLGAVFIAITIMFTLLFRSLYLALIAITPNLLAAGMVLGGMGVLGIPLDMMTITVAAITVGIGVDDTIHYIHRFKKEFAKDRDYVATMYRCHSSIGRAMFYTSVIIIMGFSILSLSNFTPTIYFGMLTGFAMFSALLGALLLLPRLILTLKPLGAE